MTSEEFEKRLDARADAATVAITAAEVSALESYFRLLARWNSTINLTALPLDSPTDQTFDRLLIEPLVAARFIEISAEHWIDLGSGGGSPAIPIKIVRPHLQLTMVESKARKAAFLQEAIRVLAMKDASVENVRFENLSTIQPVDLITVRAVRPDEALFLVAKRLLAPTGRLLLFHASSGKFAHDGFGRTEATSTLSMFHVEQTS